MGQNCLTGRLKRVSAMSGLREGEICDFCRGRMIAQNREIAFRQWTDKGYVHCRVTILAHVCTQCGYKSCDERAEATLDEAVRKEYDKLA
jgi:hypothetical protein